MPAIITPINNQPKFMDISIVPNTAQDWSGANDMNNTLANYGLDTCKTCPSRFTGCFIRMDHGYNGEMLTNKKYHIDIEASIKSFFTNKLSFVEPGIKCVKRSILIRVGDDGKKVYRTDKWTDKFVKEVTEYFSKKGEVSGSNRDSA